MSEYKPANAAKYISMAILGLGVCAIAYFLQTPKALWGLLAVGLIFNWNS